MSKVKEKLLQLIHLNNTPHEIAFGVSLGVFIGHSPLYGLHTIIALICAVLIPRINRIAVLSGISISIPPLAPFIYWAEYQVGRMILGKSYPALSWEALKELFPQNIGSFLYPLLIGSLVLGSLSALAFYLATLFVVRRIRTSRQRSFS